MIDRLILASASPARLQTLQRAGVAVSVVVSGVDEEAVTASDTPSLVSELARLKCTAVFDDLAASDEVAVLGCDSLLDVDGTPIGKPGTPEEAASVWRRLRGRSGRLWTGHHVIVRRAGVTRALTRAVSTLVEFADLSDAEIDAYVTTGEPTWVAGAFTIDGLGGAYVSRIEGDPHNVVGVSLPAVRVLLQNLGVPWHDLWRPEVAGG